MKNPTNESNVTMNQQVTSSAPWAKKTLADYQKAQGMSLAARHVAAYFPFSSTLRVVRTEQEWDAVKDEYGENLAYRVDSPVGSKQRLSVNTTGAKKDVLPLLRQLRKKNDESALLLLSPTEEFVPRHEYDGGFSALFSVNQEVLLEIVGSGFDGRNVTSGRMICERFRIPWKVASAACTMDAETLLSFREQIITPEEYVELRQQRIEELVSDDLSKEFLESVIPEEYKWPEEAVLDLVRNVIPRLVRKQPRLALEIGHEVYAMQGNFVRGKTHVWEIFDPSRWMRGLPVPAKEIIGGSRG